MYDTYSTVGRKVFNVFNYVFLAVVCLIIIIPMWNIIITSVSQDKYILGGEYLLIPKSFTLRPYLRIVNGGYLRAFYNSMGVSTVGTLVAMLLTIPMAYPLAQKNLVGRKFFMGIVVVTLLFDAGLIPLYVVVKSFGLINSYTSLILPIAMTSFNVVLMKNFFTSIPESLIESARLDGCSEAGILTRIVLPVSVPIIAAVTLFYFVHFWNRYLDVVMFINDSKKYTLQVVLRTLIFEPDSNAAGGEGVYNNTKMAVMMMGMLPVMILYPFIQRYFVSGLMLGSIKG